MWILGEYSTTVSDIEAVMAQIHQTLGEIPLVDTEMKIVAGEKSEAEEQAQKTGNSVAQLVTSDGTYASQSAFNTTQ